MRPTDLYINHQLQSEDLLANRTEYHNIPEGWAY
jgi:hypothetical protein